MGKSYAYRRSAATNARNADYDVEPGDFYYNGRISDEDYWTVERAAGPKWKAAQDLGLEIVFLIPPDEGGDTQES